MQGQSRSVFLLAALLILSYKGSHKGIDEEYHLGDYVKQSLGAIKEKGRQISINPGFVVQLLLVEAGMLDHINAVSENISHTSHVGGIRISQSRHEMIVDGSDSNFVCRKCGKMVCSMSKCLREMVIYDTATLVEEVCDEFWRSFRSPVMDRQQKRRLQREKKEKREKDGMGTGVALKGR